MLERFDVVVVSACLPFGASVVVYRVNMLEGAPNGVGECFVSCRQGCACLPVVGLAITQPLALGLLVATRGRSNLSLLVLLVVVRSVLYT